MFDDVLRQHIFCMVDYIINRPEVMYSFQNDMLYFSLLHTGKKSKAFRAIMASDVKHRTKFTAYVILPSMLSTSY